MKSDALIRVQAGMASFRSAGQTVAIEVPRLVDELLRASERAPSCGVLPECVRAWTELGDCVALAIELRPGPRTVRWLADGSEHPFGQRARYRAPVRLSFPYVIVLAVFFRGALTPISQLYYRTRALADSDDELLLPNLPNVADGHGYPCWFCLLGIGDDLASLGWSEKVARIASHVFGAGFNRSAEMHEGNSYADAGRSLDPRLASVESWCEATRSDPLFALSIPWPSAKTTLRAELARMRAVLAPGEPIENSGQLARLIARAAARKR
jgi:hypothetical protein